MLQCQKEERRNYHVANQQRLKKLYIEMLFQEFQSKDVIEVVVETSQGKEKERNNPSSHSDLSTEDQEKRFNAFCSFCLQTESGKLLLGELLCFFQKQLHSNNTCMYSIISLI